MDKRPLILLFLFFSLIYSCSSSSNEISKTPNKKQSTFMNWHNSVSDSNLQYISSNSDIYKYYHNTAKYTPKAMGIAWIIDMAKIASEDEIFKKNVLENKDKLKVNIFTDPSIVNNIEGANSAFSKVLDNIAIKGSKHRLRMDQFEAFARRSTLPEITKYKPNGYFKLSDYASASGEDPSIMERILAISALNILNFKQQTRVYNLANSNDMTNCFINAKQNSKQCEAAANDTYDLSFCMAKHNIEEVSNCTSWMLP